MNSSRTVFSLFCAVMLLAMLLSGCRPEDNEGVNTMGMTNSTINDSITTGGQIISYISSTSPNGIVIQSPDEASLKVIDASDFGIDVNSEDNTEAFVEALTYCTITPNTMLVIPNGRYIFNNTSMLNLAGASNIIVDGQGSEFIFRNIGLFRLTDCEIVEFRNLTIDWDWDYSRPANLVKIVGKDSDYLDFQFIEVDSIDIDDVAFETMNQFDSDTLTPGCANGKEFWADSLTTTKIEKTTENVLRVYGMPAQNSVNIGEYYLVRNFTCNSHCFDTASSRNITFRNITIYSAPGIGFVFSNSSSHVKLDSCVIGIRPSQEDVRHISTQADGVHCWNTSGNIWIENCDFSFMGDDGTNIHDAVGLVTKCVDSNTLISIKTFFCSEGDTVSFLNCDYSLMNFSAVITGKVDDSGSWELTFDRELPASITEGCILTNTAFNSSNYCISNNYYHENRARGILAQAGNGLITGNKFYKTQGAPILVITDIADGLWSEGVGVDGLTVSNNIFERCNVNNWTALIDIHTSIYGQASNYPVMKNLVFEGNTFIDFPSVLLHICSADTVTVKNNIIKNPSTLINSTVTRGSIAIEKSSNISIMSNEYYASLNIDQSCMTPAVSDASSNITASDNIWITQ